MSEHLIPDGIWLDLPHEVHVADPALGSTDLKAILLNAVFWHGSERNPTWRAILAADQSKVSLARAASGKAFGECLHTIALEPDQFDARYYVPPERPDLPDTKDEIAAELTSRGLTPPSKNQPKVMFEAMARMYGVTLADEWDDLIRLEANGRRIIPQNWRARVELTRRVMERHSEAMKFLRRGRAEVTVIYTDENGDRYKVRMDYLRVRTIADVKSYENKAGGEAVATFSAASAKFCYDVQAVNYMEVRTDVLPRLVAERKVWRGAPVFTDDGHVEALPPSADDLKFLDEVAEFDKPSWWWVAISTMGIPEVDTIEFSPRLLAWSAAKVQLDQAKQTYRDFRERFGADDTEMWVSDRGLIRLTDANFSARSMNRGAVLHDTISA